MKKRNMKKWNPYSFAYCDGCPWWQDITYKEKHKREKCEFGNDCIGNCDTCTEPISYCKYLNYI